METNFEVHMKHLKVLNVLVKLLMMDVTDNKPCVTQLLSLIIISYLLVFRNET